MLNIGAINSSAYAVGEAILRGMKDRSVAAQGGQLHSQVVVQTQEINARHTLSYRTITADLQKTFRTIEAGHKRSFKEVDARLYQACEDTVRMATDIILAQIIRDEGAYHNFTHLLVETLRIQAVLKKEELEEQLQIDESDAKWDLELYRYGANMLAAVTGGVTQGNDKKSKAVSALGGAISGAATGAAIGSIVPGIGTGIGAAGGALLGIGMSLLQQ